MDLYTVRALTWLSVGVIGCGTVYFLVSLVVCLVR